MVLGYSDIIYGTQALNIQTLTRKKVPGTIKQKVGMNLVKHQIPGRTLQDWEIQVTGMIYDTSTAATTARKVLEALDDKTKHYYNDGLITGSYIIESLDFRDAEDKPSHFEFTINLIEYNQ